MKGTREYSISAVHILSQWNCNYHIQSNRKLNCISTEWYIISY